MNLSAAKVLCYFSLNQNIFLFMNQLWVILQTSVFFFFKAHLFRFEGLPFLKGFIRNESNIKERILFIKITVGFWCFLFFSFFSVTPLRYTIAYLFFFFSPSSVFLDWILPWELCHFKPFSFGTYAIFVSPLTKI